jgi:hypothetical protein
MGYSHLMSARGATSIAASTTVYYFLGQTQTASGAGASAEATAQVPYRTPGTISHMMIRMVTNDRGTSTVTLRKNTANGNNALSITSSTTGDFEDTTHTDSIAAGDLVCAQVVTGAGGTTFSNMLFTALFTPNVRSQTLSKFIASNSTSANNVNAASTTFYQPLCGQHMTNNSSETNVPFAVKTNGTLKNLSCHVSSNTNVSAATVRSRKNSANGNLSLSVTALTSGVFEDTSNSDVVVSGDTLNYSITTGIGTVGAAFDFVGSEFITSNGVQQIAAASSPTSLSVAGGTRYCTSGDIDRSTVELDGSNKLFIPMFLNNLTATFTVNTITATSTFDVRKNSASGNNTISIASSTTGTFSDVTHLDKYVPGDKFNYRFVPGGTGTAATVSSYGHTFQNIPETQQFFGCGI